VNSDLELLREELLDASLIVDSRELIKAYGHLSARIPGRDAMLMTPRRSPGLLTDLDEIIVVDFDGSLLEGMGPVAIEAALHSEIYRTRPDIASVVRTHAKYSNVMSILRRPPRVVHGFGSFLGAEVPIFDPPILVADPSVARDVVAVLGVGDAILLRGNGSVVVGGSVPEATVKAIFLEESCELQYLALCAGQPVYLSEAEIASRRDSGHDYVGRAWEYYRERMLFESEFTE
jgi:HCOMODA/2-hydroxy-3-carboxy-muconic semialdehyde decarboxylase